MVYLCYYIRKWVRFLEEKTKEIQKKNMTRGFRILLVLAIILGAVGTIKYFQLREFRGYDLKAETELYPNLMGYGAGNDRLLLYSNDGAKAIDNNGKVLWETSYQLDNPKIAYCENVAAVADIGGNMVHVVAENGIPHSYEVNYPIIKHEVAKQGLTAVLLDNETEDFIQLYDINGVLRVDINTKTKTDGIPIDIALSPDGKKLVTLYITFQGGNMICKTTFYNADEVGKNYVNNIVGQKTYPENLLAYDICFINEETVCVMLENGFALYHMTEIPELICEETVEETVTEIVCVKNGIYIIKETADKQKRISFYNEKGIVQKTWDNVPEYESISATAKEMVFFSPQKVTVLRANGTQKFATAFTQNLEAVLPAGNNRYFLIGAGKVQTISLTGNKNNEEQKEND